MIYAVNPNPIWFENIVNSTKTNTSRDVQDESRNIFRLFLTWRKDETRLGKCNYCVYKLVFIHKPWRDPVSPVQSREASLQWRGNTKHLQLIWKCNKDRYIWRNWFSKRNPKKFRARIVPVDRCCRHFCTNQSMHWLLINGRCPIYVFFADTPSPGTFPAPLAWVSCNSSESRNFPAPLARVSCNSSESPTLPRLPVAWFLCQAKINDSIYVIHHLSQGDPASCATGAFLIWFLQSDDDTEVWNSHSNWMHEFKSFPIPGEHMHHEGDANKGKQLGKGGEIIFILS